MKKIALVIMMIGFNLGIIFSAEKFDIKFTPTNQYFEFIENYSNNLSLKATIGNRIIGVYAYENSDEKAKKKYYFNPNAIVNIGLNFSKNFEVIIFDEFNFQFPFSANKKQLELNSIGLECNIMDDLFIKNAGYGSKSTISLSFYNGEIEEKNTEFQRLKYLYVNQIKISEKSKLRLKKFIGNQFGGENGFNIYVENGIRSLNYNELEGNFAFASSNEIDYRIFEYKNSDFLFLNTELEIFFDIGKASKELNSVKELSYAIGSGVKINLEKPAGISIIFEESIDGQGKLSTIIRVNNI